MMVPRVKEGIRGAELISRRYDVHRHNPRNEFDCGHIFARYVASIALTFGISGLTF